MKKLNNSEQTYNLIPVYVKNNLKFPQVYHSLSDEQKDLIDSLIEKHNIEIIKDTVENLRRQIMNTSDQMENLIDELENLLKRV